MTRRRNKLPDEQCTTAEREAMTPAQGYKVHDTDEGICYVWNQGQWEEETRLVNQNQRK